MEKKKKVPELRFPGFNGEWEKKKLRDLLTLESGYAFQSKYFSNSGNKLVIPKNFTKDGWGLFTQQNSKYTIESCPSNTFCYPGDLLVLLTDLTPSCALLGKPMLLTRKDGTVLL